MSTLVDRLNWYHRQQDKVLDYQHRFSVDYSIKDIEHWTRLTRQVKLTMLNNDRNFYETKSRQKTRNQSTIYDWMRQYKHLSSGEIIGDGLTDACDVGW